MSAVKLYILQREGVGVVVIGAMSREEALRQLAIHEGNDPNLSHGVDAKDFKEIKPGENPQGVIVYLCD